MTIPMPRSDQAVVVRAEATMQDVLATQERYDNHCVDSPAWAARRSALANSKRRRARRRS
jgi:hypothetical protein